MLGKTVKNRYAISTAYDQAIYLQYPALTKIAFPSGLQFNPASQRRLQDVGVKPAVVSPVAQLYQQQPHVASSKQAPLSVEQQPAATIRQVENQVSQRYRQQLGQADSQAVKAHDKLKLEAAYFDRALKTQLQTPQPGLVFAALSENARKLWKIITRQTQAKASEKYAALAESEADIADKPPLNLLG